MKTISFLVRLLVMSLCSVILVEAQQPQGWVTLDGSDLPPIQVYAEGEEPPTPPPTLNFSGIYPASNSVAAIGNEADVAKPEVIELARGLEYSPEKIFTWVRDNIAFTHYYGVVKGAALTLEERSGNDADTCALMVSLLRQCATVTSASYVQGVVKVPISGAKGTPNLADWLGVDGVPSRVSGLIVGRGTPSDNISSVLTLNGLVYQWKRWWVRVVTLAGVVEYDPSFKLYEQTAGMDMSAPFPGSYSRASLLSSVDAQMQPDGGVKMLYLYQFEQRLSNQAYYFTKYVEDNLANAGIASLIGEQRFLALGSSWVGEPHFPLEEIGESAVHTALPTSLMTKVRVRAGALDWTLKTAELGGRTLWMTLKPVAQLYLDDTLIATEPGTGNTAQIQFQLDVDHVGTGRDQSMPPKILPRVGVRTIGYGFEAGADSLNRHQRSLAVLRSRSTNLESDRIRAEALSVMAASWLLQTQGCTEVLSRFAKTSVAYLHRFGFVADEYDAAQNQGGYYIDFPVQTLSVTGREGDADVETFSTANTFIASALEHAVIAQTQSGDEAASAAGLICGSLKGYQTLYLANSANWTSIQSQLTQYSAADVATINAAVIAGASVLLPQAGDLKVKLWSGAGYMVHQPQSGGVLSSALISGGYKGGYSGLTKSISASATYLLSLSAPSLRNSAPATLSATLGGDPVNMSSGQFVHEVTDLVTGSGEMPYGLTLSRRYDGLNRLHNDSKLGHGWTHSLDITASKSSDMELAASKGSARESAAWVINLYSVYDLFKSRSTIKEWALSVAAANFAAQSLINNVVAIRLPDRVLQFHQRPSSSSGENLDFQAPNGCTASLVTRWSYISLPHDVQGPPVPVRVGYNYQERDGARWMFDSGGQLSYVRNAKYKTAAVSWPTPTTRTFTDCYNRKITLNYNAGLTQLLSAIDSAGNTVTFDVNSSTGKPLLMSVTDVEQKKSWFSYDSEMRLTLLRDHEQRPIVENTLFDSQHRVIEQISQGDAERKWRYYYRPGQTIEENPLGQKTRHLFDDQKRNVGTINALGHGMSSEYDAQDHVVKIKSPLGFTSRAVYNSNNTVSSTVNALEKSTTAIYYQMKKSLIQSISTPTGQTTTVNSYKTWYVSEPYYPPFPLLSYDPESVTDAAGIIRTYTYIDSGPAEGEVSTMSVAGVRKSRFTYNDKGLLDSVYEGSSTKERLKASYTYTALGDVETVTDINGAQTAFTYNKRRQIKTKVLRLDSSDPFPITTTYTYDGNGNVETVTNPRGFTTTTSYNAIKKLKETILPGNAKLKLGYDLADRPETVTNALNETVTTTMDAAGQATHVKDHLNRTTITGYDADGRAETVTDALTRLSRTIYNAQGEVKNQIQPDTLDVSKTYDDSGRPLTLTNRSGNTWTFGYDTAGRQKTITSPMGKVHETFYDTQGRVSERKEPSGDRQVFVYDSHYERLSKTLIFPAQNTNLWNSTINYYYQENGLEFRTDDTAHGYGGDPRRLVEWYEELGGNFNYQYDKNSNLKKVTLPDTKTITYGYDNRDRLEKITDWANRVTTLVWDDANRLKSVTRPNNTVRSLYYDGAGQLTRIEERTGAGRLIQMVKLGLDAVGRAERRFTVPLPAVASFPMPNYTYNKDNWINELDYDADGNMKTLPEVPAPIGQPNLRALPGIKATPETLAKWDSQNRLTSIKLADGSTQQYKYNSENYRTRKTNGSRITEYTNNPHGLSGMSECTVEYNLPDQSTRIYVWGGPAGLLYVRI